MSILTRSPIENSRLFLWFAQYDNDEYFYEYDNKFNEFDSIKKNELKNFGMIGMNMVMQYDVKTGIFDICNRKISFAFEDKDGNKIDLTNSDQLYNDCISYKSAETVLIGKNQGRSSITGYHFGYKTSVGGFNLKVIVHIPMYGRVNMDVSINTDKDICGDLCIIRNGNYEKSISLELIKNQTSTINWVVV